MRGLLPGRGREAASGGAWSWRPQGSRVTGLTAVEGGGASLTPIPAKKHCLGEPQGSGAATFSRDPRAQSGDVDTGGNE